MRSAIAKWGNSLALRLPRSLAEDARMAEGTPIDLHVDGEKLVVTVARPRYKLSDLLDGMGAQTRHGETDWGEPRGDEAW